MERRDFLDLDPGSCSASEPFRLSLSSQLHIQRHFHNYRCDRRSETSKSDQTTIPALDTIERSCPRTNYSHIPFSSPIPTHYVCRQSSPRHSLLRRSRRCLVSLISLYSTHCDIWIQKLLNTKTSAISANQTPSLFHPLLPPPLTSPPASKPSPPTTA